MWEQLAKTLKHHETGTNALKALRVFAKYGVIISYAITQYFYSDIFILDDTHKAIINSSTVVTTLLGMLQSNTENVDQWCIAAEGLLLLKLF